MRLNLLLIMILPIMAALVPTGDIPVSAAEKSPETVSLEASSPAQDPAVQEEGMMGLENLLGEIVVPQNAAGMFNNLYSRHKTELYRILNNNPYMIWQTLLLVADSMPALRSMAGGKLSLDGATYSRADTLYHEYLRLASPELAADLQKARGYVDGRTEQTDSGSVVIDLTD
ncbi:hypothetical protein [Desulfoferrobacter suflitae]|uniref:hypothetical protein n=1 Tax=Desulfoferrobacter suflitae TaxID=2865782 RepID=UPI0021643CD9|nr:hypothetical protein [Desulfoferrobacter suflitae]MCK8600579.1 hypothetical protein [Desulfoferrobacter suflitae]